MKVLKIKGFQIFANYRKPMSFNFWDTYPLPPLSTVKGWFHSVVKANEYIPLSMSIQGNSEGLIYDLQKIIKFDRKNNRKKDDVLLENIDKVFHKTITYVANIYEINLCIYINAPLEYLELFRKNIFLLEYPSLGRYEDLIRIDEAKIIDVNMQDFSLEEHTVNYGIYLNKHTADSLGVRGINYRMNFKYDGELLNKTGIRYFEKKDVVYVDEATIEDIELLYDEEENRIIDFIGDV